MVFQQNLRRLFYAVLAALALTGCTVNHEFVAMVYALEHDLNAGMQLDEINAKYDGIASQRTLMRKDYIELACREGTCSPHNLSELFSYKKANNGAYEIVDSEIYGSTYFGYGTRIFSLEIYTSEEDGHIIGWSIWGDFRTAPMHKW